MAIRKSTDIENESDSKYNNVKSVKKRAKITKRFDDTTHNPYPGDEALQYLSKKLDDVIDETNKSTTASGSYASDIKNLTTASGSFSTRVTKNDAKVSSPFPAITTKAKGTVSIQSIQHIPAATLDTKDTLNIQINLTTPKGVTTTKTFTLNAN